MESNIKEAISEEDISSSTSLLTESCKGCTKNKVCQALTLAKVTNEQFDRIPFLNIKMPIIKDPFSLAKNCEEFEPPRLLNSDSVLLPNATEKKKKL